MMYQQSYNPSTDINSAHANILQLSDVMPGFVLEDDVLKNVREAYDRIMGVESGSFMNFDDREGAGNADEDDADTADS